MKKPNPVEYIDIQKFNDDMMTFIAERIVWLLEDADRINNSRSILPMLAFDLLWLFWKEYVDAALEQAERGDRDERM